MFARKPELPKHSPVQSLKIAAPCKVGWDTMDGDDRIRHCRQCNKNVYNISAMTEAEANQFLLLTNQSACTGFYRRADGTILLDNCPIGLRKLRDQYKKIAAAITTTLALLQGILVAGANPNNNETYQKRSYAPSMLGGAPARVEEPSAIAYRKKAIVEIGSALPKHLDMGGAAGTLIVGRDGHVRSISLVAKSPSEKVDRQIVDSLQNLVFDPLPADYCPKDSFDGAMQVYFECRSAQRTGDSQR